MINTYNVKKVNGSNNIARIIKEFSNEFSPPLLPRIGNLKKYSQKLDMNAFVIVVSSSSGDDCGFLAMYSNNYQTRVAYITSIAVKEEFRNMGVGTILIQTAIKTAQKEGMKAIRLEVRKVNITAISFYERFGFSKVGSSSDDSMYMEKNI